MLIGTTLFLNLADSAGNSGGIPPLSYTVAASTNDACLYQPPATSLKVDVPANSLDTCSTLPIYITGGSKPYTVTIAAADQVAPINATMGAQDNYYEFLNKYPPNTRLVAAVSDR